jgi:hypothetical protein
MKALFALITLLTLSNTYASVEGKVKVLDAHYDAASDSVNISAEISGICDSEASVRLRGCTDFLFPNTCFLDVNAVGESCDEVTTIHMSYSRDELDMKSRRFSDATLLVQNNKGKTRKSVRLPINR